MISKKYILQTGTCVILADGSFPKHHIPLEYLKKASYVIACDGAADSLLEMGYIPDAVIGDLDSVSQNAKQKLSGRFHHVIDQDSNDLTKAVRLALSKNIDSVVILGASGKREDHTLGNMGLMFDYCKELDVLMITDNGMFIPAATSLKLETVPGQQVSLFCNRYDAMLSSKGLLYPLKEMQLKNWWMGTLNQATGEEIEISFDQGEVLIGLIFTNGK